MSLRKDEPVQLDLNNPIFQRNLFGLQKKEQWAVFQTLRKLSKITWQQIYDDRGLKWEVVYSRSGPNGEKLYSFRIGKGFRAVAYREESWLRILFLHPAHDTAYE